MKIGEAARAPRLLFPEAALNTDTFELAGIASALLRHRHDLSEGADRAFVVVELGAGYGRWSLETIGLGRRLGLKVARILDRCTCPDRRQLLDVVRMQAGGLDRTPPLIGRGAPQILT